MNIFKSSSQDILNTDIDICNGAYAEEKEYLRQMSTAGNTTKEDLSETLAKIEDAIKGTHIHAQQGFRKHTVSFSKVVLRQGAVNKVFVGVFLMFLSFFHSKIWAKFHFCTFKPYE